MPMVGERWLPVIGYELYYHASNWGRIKSLSRLVKHSYGGWKLIRERIMKPRVADGGHLQIGLNRDGKVVKRWVHQLVLGAFVGPCPEGLECCHNDGNPSNNRVDNLRWDTHKANSKDRALHGTVPWGEKHYRAKLNDEKVREIVKRLAAGETQSKIAAEVGISQTAVSKIKRGKNWKHLNLKEQP